MRFFSLPWLIILFFMLADVAHATPAAIDYSKFEPVISSFDIFYRSMNPLILKVCNDSAISRFSRIMWTAFVIFSIVKHTTSYSFGSLELGDLLNNLIFIVVGCLTV